MGNDDATPDILDCLANLSSDEVFTSPELANQMLDLLPQGLFESPDTTFLDPCCKSGVFLREITKRLIKGLEKWEPDLQKRIDHILGKQVFGIALTQLTSNVSRRSLYCSKKANGKYSITTVFDPNSERGFQGNIKWKRICHSWNGLFCDYCGVNKIQLQVGGGYETHAYWFIHTKNPEGIFNMKFDVIVGNPPYQLDDGGNGKSAKPIYQLFVQNAIKLNPRYLSMIIPARWYSGGKGLDDFRKTMLNDERVRKIIDFENSAEIFKGVDIAGGICYFLWDRDSRGLCEVTNYVGDKPVMSVRKLNEFGTFIRQAYAERIVKKVINYPNNSGAFLSDVVSVRKPFGLPTNYRPKEKGIPCWFLQRIGLKYADPQDVSDPGKLLNKWKLLIPPTPIAGQTDFSKPVGFYYDGNIRIAKPGECCTESYLVACAFDKKSEVESFKSYLFTKIVRFLLLQTVVSQHVSKANFCFVPKQVNWDVSYSDAILRRMWNITDDEWAYINSKISDASVDDKRAENSKPTFEKK
jgi:site-specific DNA-methyltransferase (adenine-specific)